MKRLGFLPVKQWVELVYNLPCPEGCSELSFLVLVYLSMAHLPAVYQDRPFFFFKLISNVIFSGIGTSISA